MITPTIGRKVWFRPSDALLRTSKLAMQDKLQALDATVIFVQSDTCVNVKVTDHVGIDWVFHNVRLLQPEEQRPNSAIEHFVEWMPYQQQQAVK